MKRKQLMGPLFVVLMLTLGGIVLSRWHTSVANASTNSPSSTYPFDNMPMYRWHGADAKQVTEGKQTIEGQLTAFKKSDFNKAITYQSKLLRIRFPTAESFQQMMFSHYTSFCNFKSVKYGRFYSDLDGDKITGEVFLVGNDNSKTSAIYFLVRENGLLRVNGVSTAGDRPFSHHFMRHMPVNPSVSANPRLQNKSSDFVRVNKTAIIFAASTTLSTGYQYETPSCPIEAMGYPYSTLSACPCETKDHCPVPNVATPIKSAPASQPAIPAALTQVAAR